MLEKNHRKLILNKSDFTGSRAMKFVNKISRCHSLIVFLGTLLLITLGISPLMAAENIDPQNNDSQFAWGENVGWINAEPDGDGGPGVEVQIDKLTGYMWGENTGWISLSCENEATCLTLDYGVTNDGVGNLGGFAWGENIGWINFSCANNSTCGTANYGVTIDPDDGEFSGYAWSENVGWISFSCENNSSCGTLDYGLQTAWTLRADLSVSTTDSTDPVIVGDPFSYQITVSNVGPDDATNVIVTDTLPGNVTFQSTAATLPGTGSCSHDGSLTGGVVTCDGFDMAAGAGE
jgi:uncharacterized repeat protein (TIGR01451 family)